MGIVPKQLGGKIVYKYVDNEFIIYNVDSMVFYKPKKHFRLKQRPIQIVVDEKHRADGDFYKSLMYSLHPRSDMTKDIIFV